MDIKKKQVAAIEIVIYAIEKCINLSFVGSTTGLRFGILYDPLRDRDPLDRTLMTSLTMKENNVKEAF